MHLDVHGASAGSPAYAIKTAVIFSLRLLNLPVPLIPHMYRMLLEEIKEAQASKRLPEFTHYLLWGRGYALEGNEQEMGLGMNGVRSVWFAERRSLANSVAALR